MILVGLVILSVLELFLYPWKFHIAPENTPSQKESSLPTIIFQGRTPSSQDGISSGIDFVTFFTPSQE